MKYEETRINLQRERKFMERLMIQTMLIFFPQTWILLGRKLCCTSLKTTKQCSRWSWREEVQQWDMFPEPTELLSIDCLTVLFCTQKFKSVALTPNTNSQTCWLKGSSLVMSGTIFFICSISAISAPLAAPRISAWQAAPQWRRGFKIKKRKSCVQVATSSDEHVFFYCDKFLHRIQSDCI